MGSYTAVAQDNEQPVHTVIVPDFYIGRYEVTQNQWQAVMGSNPSDFKGDNRPVEQVSWNDVQLFLDKLEEMTGQDYRLPTEAEWEFAASGGNKSRGYKFAGSNSVSSVAWYAMNSDYKSHPVGRKIPNELGIYDMSGNVWEWCSDWYDSDYYRNSPKKNPKGPDNGKYRVFRGGSWFRNAVHSRSAARSHYSPGSGSGDIGFRLVFDP